MPAGGFSVSGGYTLSMLRCCYTRSLHGLRHVFRPLYLFFAHYKLLNKELRH